MENENSVSIPVDVVVEIFKRLPAKSLMRFKCLSKQYASIIQSQNFVDLFYSYASTKRPRFLFSFRNRKGLMLYSARPHTDESFSSSLICTSTEARHAMTITHNLLMIRTPPVRGLICFSIRPNQYVICNPSTNQLLPLPRNESWKDQIFVNDVLFGYEPISNRFKVICILYKRQNTTKYQFWIFTVGDGNSWRKIKDVPYPYRPIFDMITPAVCINGVLYYQVYTDVQVDRFTMPVVISFDLKSENFNLFKLPSDTLKVPKLIEYQGKLAFIDTSDDICVWVLENNEWSNMYNLSWTIPDSVWDFTEHKAAGICDGEIVFVTCRVYPFLTLNLNLEKKTFARVQIRIPFNNVSTGYDCFPNYFENIVLLK